MIKKISLASIGIITLLLSACAQTSQQNDQMIANQLSLSSPTMKIISPAFENNTEIPSKYTCDGENISPPLQIEGVPKGTKSLVLIVDDPDAPAGDWVHWLVWNIPPQTTTIAENSVPPGVQGTTDFGKTGYGGPCPPSGSHRYFFKLYALETEIKLDPATKKDKLLKIIEPHTIDSTHLIGLYQRK